MSNQTEFGGHIARTVQESVPAWPSSPQWPTDPLNVITIVLDDVGFAQLGCYGSSISTPAIDSLAAEGARFANFHATALCSPTRAALLTGRNHHSVGVGFLADFDSGFPGYRGAVDPSVPMLPEMLREHGYANYAVGKWHLTPPADLSPAGPFRQWPTGRGFDRYYGFLGGEEDQWAPELWEDQHYAELPEDPDYHLSVDLVDRAQRFLSDHLSVAPERPFYLHLAFGAGHAPHHAPREFIERYRSAFDHGWDVERERILARQIELGIVPEGTPLPPPNPGVASWDSLSTDQQTLYARMQEVFAGFLEHTDVQIGRFLEFLRTQGLLENTIIVLMSDNGASGEGGPNGLANEYRYFLGMDESFEETFAQLDELGSPMTHNHYPAGWAQAGNTPLRMYKKYSYAGGVRVPFILRHPQRIERPEVVRHQFQHVTDVVPTILDLLGLDAASDSANPTPPLDGASFVPVLEDPDARASGRTQYFETAGYRGLVKDGWKAVADHVPGSDYDEDRWELFSLADDFSEVRDVADEHPSLVQSLVEEWWREAERNGVLPLDDRMQDRVQTRNVSMERMRYRLLPGARLPNGAAAPAFGDREFSIEVRTAALGGAENGVLVAYGRRAAGFVFYLDEGRAVFELNRAGERTRVVTRQPVPDGTTSVAVRLSRFEAGAQAEISFDARPVARGELPALMPAGLGCLSLQVGYNSPSPVSHAYTTPARFTGVIEEAVVEFTTPVPGMSAEHWRALMAID